jgi:hypothetical protein
LQVPVARAAFPLWTQQNDGRFIVIDTATGKYRLAPHQPEVTPFTFAYDPQQDLLWMLANDPANTQYLVLTFDPQTGETKHRGTMEVDGSIYSLTYRRHDGMLYALFYERRIPDGTPWVVRINPQTGTLDKFVVSIKRIGVPWNSYFYQNNPPINLVFDPLTDVCYYTSPLGVDGGVLFQLDLSTGESTVATGTGGTALFAAVAFEPFSHRLYFLSHRPESIGSILWYATFNPKQLDPFHYLPGKLVGTDFPQTPGVYTSLAFVPKVKKE